jgi:plasmid stability protein
MQSMITMKSLFSRTGTGILASITIRNLDDDVKARLRLAAARHGCSMEEEVRRILKSALLTDDNEYGLGTRIHKLFADLGGIEIPERDSSDHRPLPDIFDFEE